MKTLSTLSRRWPKDLVEAERSLAFPMFRRSTDSDISIFYIINSAEMIGLPRQERSHTTVNPDTSCSNKTVTIESIEWSCIRLTPCRLQICFLPLRSWTWLYSFRFSSRTLWYPEAAWARPWMCIPTKNHTNSNKTKLFLSPFLKKQQKRNVT